MWSTFHANQVTFEWCHHHFSSLRSRTCSCLSSGSGIQFMLGVIPMAIYWEPYTLVKWHAMIRLGRRPIGRLQGRLWAVVTEHSCQENTFLIC